MTRNSRAMNRALLGKWRRFLHITTRMTSFVLKRATERKWPSSSGSCQTDEPR
jgi:hypothetical protein